ncbi:MAG: ferredoxin--NADP+ reductase [Myxococcota bacterium]|jgi:ferredoxin--NADP+ reductase
MTDSTGADSGDEPNKHLIGICGGAVAGSEAAVVAVSRGARVVVFEQNTRPYGKIEDGLPRWHRALRNKEFGRIDANMVHPSITFVPRTRLGDDVDWKDVTEHWGLNALVLSNGAWRDRPLPIDGVKAYLGKGLVYQNSLVYWFNRYPEPGYAGPRFDIHDAPLVVGGGLASIDVCKLLNLELYAAALRERDIEVDVEAMEHAGIPKTLESHGLTQAELGLKGALLIYRRRAEDMPLATAESPDAARLAQLQKVRVKILNKVIRKYLVRFQPLTLPHAAIVEDGQMRGLICKRTRLDGRSVVAIDGSEHEIRADMVVSSIGSVPERLEGVETSGELYAFKDWDTGLLDADSSVYGLGNVLTGKGNIKDSRRNARDLMNGLMTKLLERPPAGADAHARVDAWVKSRWEAVGYTGDYAAWIAAHPPH